MISLSTTPCPQPWNVMQREFTYIHTYIHTSFSEIKGNVTITTTTTTTTTTTITITTYNTPTNS